MAVLYNFGGPRMAGYRGTRVIDTGMIAEYQFEDIIDFKTQIKKKIISYNESARMDDRPELHEIGFVFATTSSLQERAEDCLERFGFTKGESYVAPKYKGVSRQTVWTMAAAKFVETANAAEQVEANAVPASTAS